MRTIAPLSVLKDYKGKAIKRRDENGAEEPMTFQFAVQQALGAPLAGDDKLDYTEKRKLHKLAERCEHETVAFNAAETKAIQERVAKFWSNPVIVGRVGEMIDPDPEDQPRTNGAAERMTA